MTRAGVGMSTVEDALRAVDEAVLAAREGLGDAVPDFAVAFVTAEHHRQLPMVLARLTAMSGTPYVAGCTGAGVIASGREVEDGPAIGVLLVASRTIRATPFLFDAEDLGYTTGVRLGERMVGSRRSGDLIVAWPDPFAVRPDRFLRGLDGTLPGVGVVGGAAASGGLEGATRQFRGEDFRESGVSGFRLGGEVAYRVGVTQGCRPLGPPMRITDAHENLILELDGRSAFERLREVAPDGALDDLDRAVDFLFVARVPGASGHAEADAYPVRNLVTLDPDTGCIGVSDTLDEGQRVTFAIREADAARDDLARTVRRLADERDAVRYRFGLYFDCVARGEALYGEPGVDAAHILESFPDVPVLGFFCNAELAPADGINRLYTYSGVLAMIGDREPD